MKARRGFALVIVLVVTLVVAMVTASLLYRLRAESGASVAESQREQAWLAASAGMWRVAALLQSPGNLTPSDLLDQPALFQHQLVCEDGGNRWYFTVFAPSDDPGAVRYGPTDLASLINLQTADATTLMAIPGMTEDLADALLDYVDRDHRARPQGAEQEFYDQLPVPYRIRNGPLLMLDELLRVRGCTPAILYGEDTNDNGLLDPNEDDGDQSFPPDDSDGLLNRGLSAWLTTLSYEPDTDSEGKPRIDLNNPGSALNQLGLPSQTVDFLRKLKQEGHTFKHPSELLEMTFTPRSARPGQPPLESGVGADELPVVMDRLTVKGEQDRDGRRMGAVNVLTAPVAVLLCLPGMDVDLAQRIVDARDSTDPQSRQSTAWLFSRGILTAAQYKQVAPGLTSRSFQYHVRVVGYGLPCGQFRRLEAVVDLASGQPRVMMIRDQSRLGVPMALTEESQG